MVDEYPRQIGEHLFQKYEGQEVAIDRLVEEEIDWHRWWLPMDLRKGLIYLEYGDNPRIAGVRNDDGRRRQKRKYPAGCLITFSRPPQRQPRAVVVRDVARRSLTERPAPMRFDCFVDAGHEPGRLGAGGADPLVPDDIVI